MRKRSIYRRTEIKFLIVASIFLILLSLDIGYLNWSTNTSQLDELLSAQARMALEFDLAIRSYVSESVRPFAEKHVAEDEFIPEVMSTSFVARSVFDKVRKEFPDYIIKFSSDNPRNPANQAGPEELAMIEYFNENPQVNKWSGRIDIEGTNYVACFSARRAKESCLRCHGTPADAPRSLVDRYGSVAGFHRPVGEVIALDTVAVPEKDAHAAALARTAKESIVLISGLCLFVGAIYFVVRQLTNNLRVQYTALRERQKELDGLYRLQKLLQKTNDLEEVLSELVNDIVPASMQFPDKTLALVEIDEETYCNAGEDENWNADKTITAEICVQKEIRGRLVVGYNEDLPFIEKFEQNLIDGYAETLGRAIERLEATEAMRRSDGKYRTLYESSQDAIMMLAPPSLMFTSANPATLSLFGAKDESEFTSKGPWDVSPEYQPDGQLSSEKAKKMIEQAMRKGSNFFEWQHMTLKGREFPATVLLTRVDMDGKQILQATVRDISKTKQIEQSLRRAKKEADVANKAKSEFLANMSHEIRTPMNAIMGFAEMLESEQLEPEQKEHISMISNAGKQLLELVNDILDLSKIEANKIEIEMANTSVDELLTFIKNLMAQKAQEKGLAFEISNDAKVPSTIVTDQTRLRQCLMNLVSNSIKFTDHGHVRLSVSTERGDKDDCIRFDVEDTGIGIPSSQQEKIFETFSQADGSMTRKYGGTGLGLTITRQLAQLMGGRLLLSSEQGKGSTFSILLPLQKGSDLSAPQRDTTISADNLKAEPVAAISGNVLVAEDVPTNQILIRKLLERLGLDVTIANDGEEALRYARENAFDLVFMDIQMPNMNGYDATRTMRKEGVAIPIIALTASAMPGDEHKCLDVGCNEYLTKPIDAAKLRQIIEKHLGGVGALDRGCPAAR